MAGAAGTTPVVEFWRGNFDGLALWSRAGAAVASPQPAAVDPQRAADARLAAISEALEIRAREHPLCVWLDEGPAAAAFATWAAGAAPSGRVLVVVPAREPPARPFAEVIALGPLAAADVEALIAGAGDRGVPEGERAALAVSIVKVAQGNAAVVGVLARRLIANLRAGRGDRAPIEAGADLDGLLEDGYRALPPDAQALVLALALADEAGGATSSRAGRGRGGRAPPPGRRGGWSRRPTAAFGCPAARTGGRRSPRPNRPCGRASRRGSWRCWASMIRAARTRWRRRDGARTPPPSCGGSRRRRRRQTAHRRARRCCTNARTRWCRARSRSRNGWRW